MAVRRWLIVGVTLAVAITAPVAMRAQASARLAILRAEAHGATDARDLAALRAARTSGDEQTVRLALRAMGRLGRPALLVEITPSLRSSMPEVRAEAAHALASAVSAPLPGVGAASSAARRAVDVNTVLSTLVSRLAIEAEPLVRAAICEALARLPASDGGQIARVEAALLGVAHSDVLTERLGVVHGLESLIRANAGRWAPSGESIALLRELVGIDPDTHMENGTPAPPTPAAGPAHDARVRRLALEALTAAGHLDAAVLEESARDGDWQVRWLAMKAAAVASGSGADAAFGVLTKGLTDANPMVRMASLRGEGDRANGTAVTCQHLVAALGDASPEVVLVAVDLMASCGAFDANVSALEHLAADPGSTGARTGNRQAHARVALQKAVPSTPSWPQPAGAGKTGVRVSETPVDAEITAADLARIAAARARVTIRGVGSFDMTLLASEAPATVVRFVRLVDRGDFDGRGIAAVLPTALGLDHLDGSALSNLKSESGSWPHVRGAVGLTFGDGSDTAAIFVDLVDNPRLDHVHPVFAHVLNGMDVIDQILEGDIIEKIEIL